MTLSLDTGHDFVVVWMHMWTIQYPGSQWAQRKKTRLLGYSFRESSSAEMSAVDAKNKLVVKPTRGVSNITCRQSGSHVPFVVCRLVDGQIENSTRSGDAQAPLRRLSIVCQCEVNW